MTINFVSARRGGSWKPGQSGNPTGSQGDRALQELCRAHTEEAVKTLIVCLRNPKERLPAAIAILDRGWGKPKQLIESSPDGSPIHLHLVAAQLVSAQILEMQTEPQIVEAAVDTPQNLLDAPPPTE